MSLLMAQSGHAEIDVAIGDKADMTFCSAHVCFWPKADISPHWPTV